MEMVHQLLGRLLREPSFLGNTVPCPLLAVGVTALSLKAGEWNGQASLLCTPSRSRWAQAPQQVKRGPRGIQTSCGRPSPLLGRRWSVRRGHVVGGSPRAQTGGHRRHALGLRGGSTGAVGSLWEGPRERKRGACGGRRWGPPCRLCTTAKLLPGQQLGPKVQDLALGHSTTASDSEARTPPRLAPGSRL